MSCPGFILEDEYNQDEDNNHSNLKELKLDIAWRIAQMHKFLQDDNLQIHLPMEEYISFSARQEISNIWREHMIAELWNIMFIANSKVLEANDMLYHFAHRASLAVC